VARSLPFRIVFFLLAIFCIGLRGSSSQPLSTPAQNALISRAPSQSVCDKIAINSAAAGALRLVCRRGEPIVNTSPSRTSPQIIVIGFVGGFVRPDDQRHPEILFASYLREHYSTEIQAKVFSNHDGTSALSYVMQLLDSDHDGILSDEERKRARIIIYGHSWGASETVALAGELGRADIPVLLTIQLDLIPKPGQKSSRIPANVANAINFFQSEGLLQGRSKIVASDPAETTILGNIRMEYARRPVNCDNYNWFVRTFNKPHHEIENDPHVWDEVASLIDAEVSGKDQADQSRIDVFTSEQQRVPDATGGKERCCVERNTGAELELNDLRMRP
jgi:hypothetical protein